MSANKVQSFKTQHTSPCFLKDQQICWLFIKYFLNFFSTVLLGSCPAETSCMLGNAVQSLVSWFWSVLKDFSVYFRDQVFILMKRRKTNCPLIR